jgi:DNA-binding transcriptional LysR family regulator
LRHPMSGGLTLESIANQILTPLLSEFIEHYPDIKVELIATNKRLDLVRGDADIAIRACRPPTQSGIVVRKLADDPWKLYCSPGYAERRGVPGCASDLDRHVLIGADGEFAKLDPFVCSPRPLRARMCAAFAAISPIWWRQSRRAMAWAPCQIR